MGGLIYLLCGIPPEHRQRFPPVRERTAETIASRSSGWRCMFPLRFDNRMWKSDVF